MNIRKLALVVTYAALVGGCATATPTFTPSGEKGFAVDCSDDFNTWGDCYTKAGETCGAKGYDIIDQIGDRKSSVIGHDDDVFGSQSATRTLLISCKQ